MRTGSRVERYAWVAGIVYVAALLTESVISTGVGLTHQDGAAKVARNLHEHRDRLLLVAYFSIVYAAAFVVYLWGLYRLLSERGDDRRLSIFVLVGGVLFVALHGVSDIAITGLLGAKLADYSYLHDPGFSYTLYYMTFALDSVGDVFASLFFLAAGLLALSNGLLPRWLGWVSVLTAPFLFLQGFGLGGVIGTFGLALDLVGFVLLLLFVAASSIVLLRRGDAAAAA
jgi:hypothetical protein